MTTFWIRADGTLIHATSDPTASPPGATASTEIAPKSGRQKWNLTSSSWSPLPPSPPDPNSLLDAAINGAVNLAELKAALRGRVLSR